MSTPSTDVGSPVASTLSVLLQFAQAGLAGVAVLALVFTYQLLRREVDANKKELINRYMTLSIIFAVLSGISQAFNTVLADKTARELRDTKEMLRQAQTGAMPMLSYEYIAGNWNWQWAAGNWESEARFSKNDNGMLVFSVDTFFHQGKDTQRTLVQRFYSDAAIVIPPGGVSTLSFDGWRDVLDNPIAKTYFGSPLHWKEHFEFFGGKELRGTYRGFQNGIPVAEGGNIILYMPP